MCYDDGDCGDVLGSGHDIFIREVMVGFVNQYIWHADDDMIGTV